MRVNIYAEEMTDRVELIEKEIDGQTFRAVRFYLALPVTTVKESGTQRARHVSGPFIHRLGDDDSAAVTFWGKRDLRHMLQKAIDLLDERYGVPDRTCPIHGTIVYRVVDADESTCTCEYITS